MFVSVYENFTTGGTKKGASGPKQMSWVLKHFQRFYKQGTPQPNISF